MVAKIAPLWTAKCAYFSVNTQTPKSHVRISRELDIFILLRRSRLGKYAKKQKWRNLPSDPHWGGIKLAFNEEKRRIVV